jgi:hypothetical protein
MPQPIWGGKARPPSTTFERAAKLSRAGRQTARYFTFG